MSNNISGKTENFWVIVTGKSGHRALAMQAKNKPMFLNSQFVGQEVVGCFKNME